MPHADRRQAGAVYTPPHLVDFTLSQAGYREDQPIDEAGFLDPACGGGAFLVGAVTTLARRLIAMGNRLDRSEGRVAFLAKVVENLFGVDTDPHACAVARQAVRDRVRELAPGRLPARFFDANILVDDFLLGTRVARLTQRLGVRLRFVIGNPPYVSATRINSKQKEQLRSRFRTSGGRLDLYTVFLERALELLRPGGRVAFLTPDKFLVSQSGRGLREFILQVGAVRSIAQFKSHKIFDDAATIPCVTVIEREGAPGNIAVLTCTQGVDVGDTIQIVDSVDIPHTTLGSEPWYLAAPRLHALAGRLQMNHPSLAEVAIRVSAGPATGRDRIFVLAAGTEGDIEPELLRPALRGRDIHRYGVTDPGLWALIPYQYNFAGIPSLVDLRRFPRAADYLRRNREELETRHCVRVWQKPWFDLHDPPTCDLSRLPKLLVPDVANSNRFAVDPGRYLPLHSAYYVIPRPGVDLDFLAGVLNSTVATFLLRLFSPIVKDGFQRYRQQFLLKLPIPAAPVPKIKGIANAVRRGDFDQADNLVERLFGLSTADSSSLRAAVEQGTPL